VFIVRRKVTGGTPILRALRVTPFPANARPPLEVRIENLSQEPFDLFVRFEGTDGVLDKSLVEKVKTRCLFFCVTQDRFSPGKADCGLAVFTRYDLYYPPNRGLDR